MFEERKNWKILKEEILDESPFEFIYDNSIKMHPFRRFQIMSLDISLKQNGNLAMTSVYDPYMWYIEYDKEKNKYISRLIEILRE
ncbi:MAG: hypothetical protein QXY47_07590 [Thermoplasmata archaeon]